MRDPRIEIPAWARNLGILGGLIMMALGLLIAWRRSDMDVALPPTGWKPPPGQPAQPSKIDRLFEALLGRISGK